MMSVECNMGAYALSVFARARVVFLSDREIECESGSVYVSV